MAARGPQNSRRCLERCLTLGFCEISFLIRALLLWEKITTEEKKNKRKKRGKKEENKDFLVVTNVVGTRQPKRPLSGRLTTRSNSIDIYYIVTTTAIKSMGFDLSATLSCSSPSKPFLIERLLRWKNIFCKSWWEHRKILEVHPF